MDESTHAQQAAAELVHGKLECKGRTVAEEESPGCGKDVLVYLQA
jgi:hypothetical protein